MFHEDKHRKGWQQPIIVRLATDQDAASIEALRLACKGQKDAWRKSDVPNGHRVGLNAPGSQTLLAVSPKTKRVVDAITVGLVRSQSELMNRTQRPLVMRDEIFPSLTMTNSFAGVNIELTMALRMEVLRAAMRADGILSVSGLDIEPNPFTVFSLVRMGFLVAAPDRALGLAHPEEHMRFSDNSTFCLLPAERFAYSLKVFEEEVGLGLIPFCEWQGPKLSLR